MFTLEHTLPRARVFAPVEDRVPTPLLAFLAGAHAERIACLWPAPHGEFFALPAARRHLAAIGAVRVRPEDYAHLRMLLERAPLRDVVRFAVSIPPRGLTRALEHLGEALLPEEAYAQLLALLEEREAALVLRHADAIDVSLLERLTHLAPPLRQMRIVRHVPDVSGAYALSEAFGLALRITPRLTPHDLARTWARADSTSALYRAAMDALKPERFVDHGEPPAMARPYRPILSKASLRDVALRFRNCVEGYVWEIGAGQMALYVWEGQPATVIALRRDIGGWRFAEALAADNAVLPDDVLMALAYDFANAGVRIGPPVRAVEDRLETIADAAPQQRPDTPQTLVHRMGLGQLWR